MKALLALLFATSALADWPPPEPDLGTVFISFTASLAGGPVKIRYVSHLNTPTPQFRQANNFWIPDAVAVTVIKSTDNVNWYPVATYRCREGGECQYAEMAVYGGTYYKLFFEPSW